MSYGGEFKEKSICFSEESNKWRPAFHLRGYWTILPSDTFSQMNQKNQFLISEILQTKLWAFGAQLQAYPTTHQNKFEYDLREQ